MLGLSHHQGFSGGPDVAPAAPPGAHRWGWGEWLGEGWRGGYRLGM